MKLAVRSASLYCKVHDPARERSSRLGAVEYLGQVVLALVSAKLVNELGRHAPCCIAAEDPGALGGAQLAIGLGADHDRLGDACEIVFRHRLDAPRFTRQPRSGELRYIRRHI